MSLAKVAVEKKTVTGFTTFLLLAGGLMAYTQLGQLEDPEFTVKSAVVTTSYPGATAEEVELEVTDRLELAIQEMPQLKYVESISRAGLSLISVEIIPKTSSDQLPQVWDELRKKIGDATADLPPGAGEPIVGDDFGDVYGFLMAVTGDGYSYAELEDYVDAMKKEFSLVEGVARVDLWGTQTRCIYIDVSQTRLAQLGITMESLGNTLSQQNVVVDSGGLDFPTERLRIEQTGAFKSPEDIGDLVIRGFSVEEMMAGDTTVPVAGANDELLRIRDIATVRRGYMEPPIWQMRYNGMPALGVAISNVSGENIVALGGRIDARLEEIMVDVPVGIEVHRVSWQSDLVTESISNFMVSLAQAVLIVLVVLWVAMGFSTAMIVGLCGLVFVIVTSLLVMALWGIDLQRMSLGALVIAMGMMVDNAIVVADGILVRMQKGMNRVQAAVEAATQPSWPLLGATLIAVLAFYPIYASEESAGEYCMSLFQVVSIALVVSWVLSVTITPLMSIWLLPTPKQTAGDASMYDGRLYRLFRKWLALAIRFRWFVLGVMFVLLILAGLGFGYVDRTFFPDSARLQVMIDYWAPEGTRIQTVSADIRQIEDRLIDDPKVQSVSTFLGQGPPRFYLPVEPEKPYQSYGQLIVNLHTLKGLNELVPEIDAWMGENVPQARCLVRRYGLGPSETWKVEARISGPAIADPDVLRELGQEGVAILQTSP
ncbi:MAG: efflux RND transporter permease subunit, partial [Planctomycetes bacterium]|nr:efflux RND transporter permease subunit [Planctomycetota bacterium]